MATRWPSCRRSPAARSSRRSASVRDRSTSRRWRKSHPKSHGAVVTFVGRARNRADDGREVTSLEYEAYPEMAEATLRAVAAEVRDRWPDCTVAVVHRVGAVPIGEAAVVIVTAAPHRGDAYEANRYVIEAIKARLPIWKLEHFADGSRWKRPGA